MTDNIKTRPLTFEEKQAIVDDIPTIPSASIEVSEYVTNIFKKRIMEELSVIPIKDNKKCVDKFHELIIDSIYRSFVSPGEPVGNTAASSISSHATQSNLSAYHSTGISSLIDSVGRLLEILSGKENLSPEQMIIHFKDYNLTDYEVQMMLDSMKDITIDSLMKIDNGVDIIYNYGTEKDNPYFELYSQYRELDFTENMLKIVFRLNLDIYKLTINNVILTDVADFLENSVKDIICIPHALSDGIIDIFVNTEELGEIIDRNYENNKLTVEDIASLYFKKNIMKAISTFPLDDKRIRGMKRGSVVRHDILLKTDPKETIPGKEYEYHNNMLKGKLHDTFKLIFNPTETRISGIVDGKLKYLFKSCGFKVLKSVYTDMEVSYIIKYSEKIESALKTIRDKISKANDNYNEYRNKTFGPDGNGDIELNFEGGNIYRASIYCFAMADTDNLKKIYSIPYINSNLTILYNPVKIYRMFGIEAARNVMYRIIYELIKESGNDIAPCHIVTPVDLMCSIGQIISISARGAQKLSYRETLANATFEKPIDEMAKSALSGAEDTVKNTSSCVFTGNKCFLGTGFNEVKVDPLTMPSFNPSEEDDRYYKNKIDIGLEDIDGFSIRNTTISFGDDVDDSEHGMEYNEYEGSEFGEDLFDELDLF